MSVLQYQQQAQIMLSARLLIHTAAMEAPINAVLTKQDKALQTIQLLRVTA
jgi:hypothetical protein